MSTPDGQQNEKPDELELEPETIKDLDVSDVLADDVRGGSCAGTHNPCSGTIYTR
jgi:hypothetical protein